MMRRWVRVRAGRFAGHRVVWTDRGEIKLVRDLTPSEFAEIMTFGDPEDVTHLSPPSQGHLVAPSSARARADALGLTIHHQEA